MGINPINPISPSEIVQTYKLSQLNEIERLKQFKLQENSHPILTQTTHVQMTRAEFAQLMKNRPLIKFKPLKNSFIKKGDQVILAKALNIEPNQVDGFIDNMLGKNLVSTQISGSKDQTELVKEYVYRHGTKEQLFKFVEYDLQNEAHVLKNLYKILDNNAGGLANYFVRPIHRLDNATLDKLDNIFKTQLNGAHSKGFISEEENLTTAKWALGKIYDLQNNQRILREARFVKYQG